MTALLFDTETTGLIEPALVEAAWIRVSDPWQLAAWDTVCSIMFNPGKPIEPGAMAMHHILDEDVAACPPASEFQLPADVVYLIGHNVDFDWQVIGQPDVKRICTLALARHLWPTGVDSYAQSALLYRLITPASKVRALVCEAHRAEADVISLAVLLNEILCEFRRRERNVSSWDDVWQLSEVARIPTHLTFGKHKGMPISQVPRDYVRWLLGQPDVDPYLRKALRA